VRFNFFKDLKLKLISLAIATFLWVMVTGKEYRFVDFTIPVEVAGLSEELIVTRVNSLDGTETKTVTVRVRASETMIRTIDEKSMYLRLNVPHMTAGAHPVQLSEDMVTGKPTGAQITDISPRVLELSVEQKAKRSFVVVNPEILGKPAEGYEVFQVTCNPPAVSISGPKSSVDKTEKISTPPVLLNDLVASPTTIRREFSLAPPDPMITINPDRVTLRIEIREKVISKSFEDIELKVRGSEYETRLNPHALTVFIQGPVSQMKFLKKKHLSAFLVISGNEEPGKDLRLTPQLEVSPRDSFPDVTLERFSQSFVNAIVTSRKLKR